MTRPLAGRVNTAQTNSELTESELWMRRMASAIRRAMLTTLNLPTALPSSERGTEFVMMTSERGDSAIRFTAGPESTP